MAKTHPEGPSTQYLTKLREKVHHQTPIKTKYPIFKDPGPINHEGYGVWNQKPQMLAAWTLWERYRFGGRSSVDELTRALREGMTPIASYWSAQDMPLN